MMQMSTPVKKKKRRLSANQIDRCSIIPKFDDDFAVSSTDRLCGLCLIIHDLQIFEDDDPQLQTAAATAPLEEITLLEQLPDPQLGGSHC